MQYVISFIGIHVHTLLGSSVVTSQPDLPLRVWRIQHTYTHIQLTHRKG